MCEYCKDFNDEKEEMKIDYSGYIMEIFVSILFLVFSCAIFLLTRGK